LASHQAKPPKNEAIEGLALNLTLLDITAHLLFLEISIGNDEKKLKKKMRPTALFFENQRMQN